MNKLLLLLFMGAFLGACQSENKDSETAELEVNTEAYEAFLKKIEDDKTCAYEIKRLISAPSGEFMVTSGYRLCKDEMLSAEIIAFKKGEALGDKESNIYVTEDLRPVEVEWEGEKLVIYTYPDAEPLLRAPKIYDTEIIYKVASDEALQ